MASSSVAAFTAVRKAAMPRTVIGSHCEVMLTSGATAFLMASANEYLHRQQGRADPVPPDSTKLPRRRPLALSGSNSKAHASAKLREVEGETLGFTR